MMDEETYGVKAFVELAVDIVQCAGCSSAVCSLTDKG